MGFLYGFKTKSITNVNWLFPLSVLYSIINIYVFVSGMTNHALMAFYGLLDRVEEGLFLVRNPGIITNPNSSALAGNVILIFWVVARKFNLITYKKGLVDILVFMSIGVALVSFQSRGGFLAFGATLFFYVKEQLNIARFIYVLGVATIFIIMLVNILPKIFPDQLEVFELGVLKVLEINNEINGELEKDASSDGSRIYKVKAAFDNFILSPIFGVGSDRTTGSPLNTVWYHNDWSEMLVSTGIIGFLMLLYVFVKVYKIHAALAIPFIFGGMTNSFIVTVQIVMFYFLFVGIVVKLRGLKV